MTGVKNASCMGVERRFDVDKRTRKLHYQTLQLLRRSIRDLFSDWKDADDWLFSQLEFTKSELSEIYDGRGELVYFGSAVDR